MFIKVSKNQEKEEEINDNQPTTFHKFEIKSVRLYLNKQINRRYHCNLSRNLTLIPGYFNNCSYIFATL